MAIVPRDPLYLPNRGLYTYWAATRVWVYKPSLALTAPEPEPESTDLVPQYDYPLPPSLARPGGYLFPTQVALFAPNLPQNQYSWPLPTLPARVYAQSYGSNPANIPPAEPEPSTDIPIQYDYPLPPRLPFIIGQVPQNVIRAAPEALPFVQTSWPLPLLPSKVYAETRRASVDLLHSVQPPERQDQWPLPVQPYRVYAQSYSTGPVLLGVTPTPFAQLNWPLPVKPHRVYAESYETPAVMVAKPPFVQNDWPDPTPPPRVYAENRRSSVDLLHSVYPPIAQLSWPLPIQPPRVYAQSYSSALAILTPPAPQPVQQWPVPIQPPKVYADVRRADVGLLHSVKPPIAQYDWPDPIPPPRVYAEHRRSSIDLLHSVRPPTRQSEWPVPTQPHRVYAVSKGFRATDLPTPDQPAGAVLWPTPIEPHRVYARNDWAYPDRIPAQAKPFAQSDWPQPKRVPWSPPAQSYSISASGIPVTLTLVRLDVGVWPSPVPPARVYTPQLPSFAAVREPAGPPIRQDRWPVPTQPPRVYARNASVAAPNIPITYQLTYIGTGHWPPPIPPHRVYTPYRGTEVPPNVITVLRFAPPFEWKVPQQPHRVYAQSHRSYIPLLHSVRPFRQTEWPRPKQLLQNWPTSALTNTNPGITQIVGITELEIGFYEDDDEFFAPTIFYSGELRAGYESQVGVWHVHGREGGRTGRTGKRYRIYPPPGSS